MSFFVSANFSYGRPAYYGGCGFFQPAYYCNTFYNPLAYFYCSPGYNSFCGWPYYNPWPSFGYYRNAFYGNHCRPRYWC